MHCKAGKGRSVTVAMCYVIDKLKEHDLPPHEVQHLLQQRRPQISRNVLFSFFIVW